MNAEKLNALQTLLNKKRTSSQAVPQTAHNYRNFKELIIKQELEQEIYALIVALDLDSQSFLESFLERCATRAKQNAGTCLSFFAFSEGECNQLYIEMALILFQPATLGELIAYLEPGITCLLVPESDSADHLQQAPIRLIEHPIARLIQTPSISGFADYVAFGPYLFNLKTINRQSFQMHYSVYHELKLHYPGLAKRIYQQHNRAFRALEEHLLTVDGAGQTPKDVISKFNHNYYLDDLSLGNPRFAIASSLSDYDDPVCYLNSLEPEEKSKLLALSRWSRPRSLDYIMNQYRKDQDKKTYLLDLNVFLLIHSLQDVLDNPENQTALALSPKRTEQHLQAIKAYYNDKTSLSSVRDFDNLPLPEHFIESNISLLKIVDDRGYLSLLNHFPFRLYPQLMSVTQAKQDVMPGYFFHYVMMGLIQNGVLDSEPLSAFNQTLVSDMEFFGGLQDLLILAAKCNMDLMRRLLELIPPEQQLFHLYTKAAKSGKSIFHYATGHLPTLYYLLGLVPRDNLWATMFDTSDPQLLLHEAVTNLPHSLNIILKLVSEQDHLAAVKQENQKGHDLLYFVVNSLENLETVLRIYPEEERVFAATREYADGSTLLHAAAKSCSGTFQMLLQGYFPPDKWYVALSKKDNKGRTVLQYAVDAGNIPVIEHIISLIPRQYLLEAMLDTFYWKDNLICKAASERSVSDVFDILPISDHLVAVQQENHRGENLFSLACADAKALRIIWNTYPKEKRLVALLKENDSGNCIDGTISLLVTFHRIVPFPESLKTMLRLITDLDTRTTLIESENFYHQNALHIAATNPDSLELILNLYSPEHRAKRLNLKDKKGKSALDYAAKYPECMKVITRMLPEVPVHASMIGFFSQPSTSYSGALVNFIPKKSPGYYG